MKQAGGRDGFRLEAGLAEIQVSSIGDDNLTPLVIEGIFILAVRPGEPIQRRTDARDNQKKTDDQEGGGFEESFHGVKSR